MLINPVLEHGLNELFILRLQSRGGIELKNLDFKAILSLVPDFSRTVTESRKRVMELYSKSERDLRSARLEYANGIFDNSIFMLQQSVEKTAKGIYVLNTGASEKDLKNVNHRSLEAFLGVFKNSAAKYAQFVQIIQPSWNQITLISQIEKLAGGRKKIKKMKEAVIDKLLNIPRQIISKDSEENKFIRGALNRPDIGLVLKQAGAELTEDSIDSMIKPMYAFYSVFVMSLITFPHADSTRYRVGLIGPDDYKKGLGIVDAAPKLFDELANCISILKSQLNSIGQ